MLIVATTRKANQIKLRRINLLQNLKNCLNFKAAPASPKPLFQKMRPSAIREAAQLATFQKAMRWRYGQLVDETGTLLQHHGHGLSIFPFVADTGAGLDYAACAGQSRRFHAH